MPTVTQIENADPLTDYQAYRLVAIVQASERYQAAPWAYPSLSENVTALVDVDSIPSRHLSAVTKAIDDLKDGTVGVKGGAKGVDYSKSRDRQALCDEVLAALYPDALGSNGGTVLMGGSFRIQNVPVW
jgi:hypothetical protein